MFQASYFPGVHFVLGSWYRSDEIGRRGGSFYVGLTLGGLTAGLLQSAATTYLDGVHGLAGWRWLFIINCIMTVCAGTLGFFMLPDYPNRPNPRAIWFTRQHAELALERLARHNREKPRGVSWTGIKYDLREMHLENSG